MSDNGLPAAVARVAKAMRLDLNRRHDRLVAEAVARAAREDVAEMHVERCCDGITHDDGDYSAYTCADMDRSCRTRLVGPWSAGEA